MTATAQTAASPGTRYWDRSLHAYAVMTAEAPGGREGGPREPERFRRHGDLPRYPLPAPPRSLGDVAWSFGSLRAGNETACPPPVTEPSAAFHSALLHHTCGVLRTEFGPTARWPYHRAVPSARCFAPVETYLWTPGHDGLPAGVHAYDPAHHDLVLVRAGEFRATLGAALGADIADAVGVLLFSTVFWRTAFKYGSYAYRLCAQETGLTAGNAMLVAGALGAQGHLHHQFLDGTLERLVGAQRPEESVAAALPLYPWRGSARRPVRRSTAPWTDAELTAALGPAPDRPALTAASAPLAELVEMDGSARLTGTASFALLPRTPDAGAPVPGVPAAGARRTPELGDALRRRTSGSPAFDPVPRPVPLDAMLRIVGPLLDAHVSDAVTYGAPPPVTAHLWAARVTGLRAGLHRVTPHGTEHLRPLPQHGLGTEAANVNYRSAAAVVFLSAPRQEAQAAFGDRSFRVLHHEAGVVAQRLCVLSAAEGLAARIHNGYAARKVSRALGLPPGHEPLFQIVLGVPGADERCLMPVPGLPGTAERSTPPRSLPGDAPARNEVSVA
ncbi:SagB family peptide dehydrogenase [Streptomyces avermitilis]|uniref:SagB family peptide dehydrogenase n=1 Tax=Streptomyces avermitilis TaxID=33903 RepID=UPI0033B9DE35